MSSENNESGELIRFPLRGDFARGAPALSSAPSEAIDAFLRSLEGLPETALDLDSADNAPRLTDIPVSPKLYLVEVELPPL